MLEKDKADKPAARLTFGAVEDKLVVVKREANHKDWSESALVKAPDLLLDQAKAGPLAYYDKKLPKFSQGFDLPDKGVVKLTLDRNGEHFVISRAEAKPESPWKFEEPKEMAGRKADPAAVESILTTLDGLKATRLVAENPKDEALDKEYGLKTPALKADVTKDDKTSYTYDFGKDTADGGEYALQSQRPKMVFVGEQIRPGASAKGVAGPDDLRVRPGQGEDAEDDRLAEDLRRRAADARPGAQGRQDVDGEGPGQPGDELRQGEQAGRRSESSPGGALRHAATPRSRRHTTRTSRNPSLRSR